MSKALELLANIDKKYNSELQRTEEQLLSGIEQTSQIIKDSLSTRANITATAIQQSDEKLAQNLQSSSQQIEKQLDGKLGEWGRLPQADQPEVGEEGQLRLLGSRVLMIGAGGLKLAPLPLQDAQSLLDRGQHRPHRSREAREHRVRDDGVAEAALFAPPIFALDPLDLVLERIARQGGADGPLDARRFRMTIELAGLAPQVVKLALLFGPAEYFSLMTLGLISAVVLASGSLLKAITMVVMGLAGVFWQSISRRHGEIGVRRAAGATSGAILVHCPGTHAFFGRARFPLRDWLASGAKLAPSESPASA